MREEKRVITVDSFQHEPIEDVDELLKKILDAPLFKKRRFDCEDR